MRGARIHDGSPARVRRRARRLAAALIACVLPLAGASAASATPDPVGVHSMLQLNTPYSFMQAMFAQAAGLHASVIRLDVAPALIFTTRSGAPDYTGLDEVMALSQQYHLRVVADLLTIPPWMASCRGGSDQSAPARCATNDLAGYGSIISQIVRHADPVLRDWEIWNEPDSGEYFNGTPQQYAHMLRSAHDVIKQVDPRANVLLGGISGPGGIGWLDQVLATPGADAVHAFDVANVHQRGELVSLAPTITAWRLFLAARGFTGPLWVTEHGYPSDPAYQYDPGYHSGPASQAAFLAASIPTLVDAGASEVFVSERDNLSGPYSSEGVLGGNVSDPPVDDPQVVEKPSYAAVAGVAECYLLLGRDCSGLAPAASRSPVAVPATRPGGATVSAVTVSDPGTVPLQLGAAALALGTSPAIAIERDLCPQVLEPGQTCELLVRFHPVAGGVSGGTVTLPSDSGTLSLPVFGVSPSVSSLVARRVLSFDRGVRGMAAASVRSSRVVFSLANPLPAAVDITRVTIRGASSRRFRLTSNHCAHARLRVGGGCGLTVVLRPGRPATARAQLVLHGDGQPLIVPVSASANGLPSRSP
jgi:hypothetical protein